jgi:hypothetical protein
MAASLDSTLQRIRGGAKAGNDIILVHGPIAAGEAPWLWRYIAAKVAADPEFGLFVSSRIPCLFGVSPGVAFHSLSGPPLAIPVEPSPGMDSGLSSASSPLDVVVTLAGQALRIRSDQKLSTAGKSEQTDRTTTVPDHSMAIVVDDLPSLLLEHSVSDVILALEDLNAGVKGARCSPVVICLDNKIVDETVFTALSALSSLVIRLDEAPKLTSASGALGYQQGTLTFTEVLTVSSVPCGV